MTTEDAIGLALDAEGSRSSVEGTFRQRDGAPAIVTSAIYVPRDSSTVSLGADDVARSIAAQAAARAFASSAMAQ